jgi:hypothetical protein
MMRPDVMTPQQAYEITTVLIAEHGLTGWSVAFDRAKRRSGLCSFNRKTISLSRYIMAQRPYADTLNTITHEIAHAIVGASHRHDAVWAAKHRQLGGDGKRCFDHFDESAPWILECRHGQKVARYRAPKRLHGWQCRCEPGNPTPAVWKHHGVAVLPDAWNKQQEMNA